MRKTELVAQVSERTGLTWYVCGCRGGGDRGDIEIGGLRASSRVRLLPPYHKGIKHRLRPAHQEDH